MSLPVAIQLYSVRDDLARDFEGTLAAVKAAGYDGVEFAGLYGRSAAQVKALCDKYSLVPVSAHVPYYDMVDSPEAALAPYAEIGCAYVAIPYLTPECRPGAEGFDDVIRNASVIGQTAEKLGMTLLYHNHDFEFTKLDGVYALDRLYASVPETLLSTELDTCWVHVGGEDPASYIRKYSGRCPVVHLKDYAGQKSEHMYELIGIESDGKKSEGFEFRPVGSGKLDFAGITKAAVESGAKWLIVEQDEPSMGLTPLECAAKSREYLRTLGF